MIFPKLLFRKSVPVIGSDKQGIGRIPPKVARELVKTKHAEILHDHPSVIGLRHIGSKTASPNRVVSTSPLKNLIHTASLIASKSSRSAILNSLLFKIVDHKLCVMATDLESYFIGYLEPGTNYSFTHDKDVDGICINARHLDKIISSQNNHFHLHIIKGKENPGLRIGEFLIEGEDASGFPDVQLHKKEDTVYKGTITNVAAKLNFVGRALSTNKYRSALCGIYLDLEKLKLAGADGNRLHMVPMEGVSQETKKPGNTNETPSLKGVIVPSPLLRIGKLLTGNVRIFEGNDPNRGIYQNVIFDVHISGCMDCTATYRALEGTYPQYLDVIPKGFASRFIAKTKDVIPVLHKALIANTTDAASKPITVEFNKGVLRITTKVYERIRFQGVVNGEYSGPPYYCNINGNFLFDAVQTIPGDSIEVLLQGKNDEAWIIRNQSGFTAIIMPLGLENGN